MNKQFFLTSFILTWFLLSCNKETTGTITPCTACPTITSVSPSIGFGGQVVQIIGTQFKGVQSVFWGAQTVTPLSISPTGDTITVEVPEPLSGKEKEEVTVSLSISNPEKPTEVLNSNLKGKFKYAEIVTEEFAGKLGDTTGKFKKWVDVPKNQARFFIPMKIVVDNQGNLYVMSRYKLDKIDIKTGLVTTVLTTSSIAASFYYFYDIEITPNNQIYLATGYHILKYSPESKITEKVFEAATRGAVETIDYYNQELFYIYRHKTSVTGADFIESLNKLGSNTKLITFPLIRDWSKYITALRMTDNNKQYVMDYYNVYQYADFKNPQPLFNNNFITSVNTASCLIDNQNRLHCLRNNEWIIKSLNVSDSKPIYKTLPAKYAGQITPDNLGNYYVADTGNERILKVSLK